MIKKISLLLFIVISLSFCMNSVYADCSECDVSDCASCGCVLSSSGESCVYDNYESSVMSCGDDLVTNIPSSLPKFISVVYSIIQVVIPILLVIFGSLDLVKGIIAQKDDDIRKGQQLLIKRLITAALVFFVFVIVKFLISIVADNESDTNATRIIECADCFINNKCDIVAGDLAQ